jgi:DNA-binding response OmpR family regulator
MSVVEGKRVAFVGSMIPEIISVRNALLNERSVVSSLTCGEVLQNPHSIESVDLVILNQQQNEAECATILSHLQNSNSTKHMPVITYVNNVEARINRALMSGAADYFTPADDIDSILQKVKNNFGMPNTYEGVSQVDISERVSVLTDQDVKVYVVEDDPLLRSLLSTKFDMSNVTYDFSSDGLSVEEKLRVFKPTVILLDIMIGGVNGLDILEAIKQQTDLATIPVVVFSNQDSDEERKRAATLGADSYLVKATTDLSDLIKVLASFSK